MVRAWLLLKGAEKKILEADGCDTVESLKKRFAPQFNCDFEQLEALLFAKPLPDSARLTADAGFDEKLIVTLLRKKCPVDPSCYEVPSKEQMERDVRAFREILFANEEVNRQKIHELRKLTSNAHFVDEMIISIPSLRSDPVIRSVIHDWPLLRRWTSEPDFYKVCEHHPSFSKVLGYLTNALKKQQSNLADGPLSDPRSQIHFERMALGSDSDTDVSSDDANPSISGANVSQLPTLPLSPELAAAFDLMSQFINRQRRNVLSQNSNEPAESAPSTSDGQRPILTTQMLQQAIQSSTNFGHELQQSLNRLHEMGFIDDEENKRVLAQCNYDFDRALEMIIQRREENNNFS